MIYSFRGAIRIKIEEGTETGTGTGTGMWAVAVTGMRETPRRTRGELGPSRPGNTVWCNFFEIFRYADAVSQDLFLTFIKLSCPVLSCLNTAPHIHMYLVVPLCLNLFYLTLFYLLPLFSSSLLLSYLLLFYIPVREVRGMGTVPYAHPLAQGLLNPWSAFSKPRYLILQTMINRKILKR